MRPMEEQPPEEDATIVFYQDRRGKIYRMIETQDGKIREARERLEQVRGPKVARLRHECSNYSNYNAAKTESDNLTMFAIAYDYFNARENQVKWLAEIKNIKSEIRSHQATMTSNHNTILELLRRLSEREESRASRPVQFEQQNLNETGAPVGPGEQFAGSQSDQNMDVLGEASQAATRYPTTSQMDHDTQARLEQLRESVRTLRSFVHNKRIMLGMLVENFQSCYYQYNPAEPAFGPNKVSGPFCKLFEVGDLYYCLAIEAAGANQLFSIVVDTAVTGARLKRAGQQAGGQVGASISVLPLNLIYAAAIVERRVVNLAQALVGPENVQLAFDLISYEDYLRPVMAKVFGRTFVCRNLDIAMQIVLHPFIRCKCVTLDGHILDVNGTLTHAPFQNESVLLQLRAIKDHKNELRAAMVNLTNHQEELNNMQHRADEYNSMLRESEINDEATEAGPAAQLNQNEGLQAQDGHIPHVNLQNVNQQFRDLCNENQQLREYSHELQCHINGLETKISNGLQMIQELEASHDWILAERAHFGEVGSKYDFPNVLNGLLRNRIREVTEWKNDLASRGFNPRAHIELDRAMEQCVQLRGKVALEEQKRARLVNAAAAIDRKIAERRSRRRTLVTT